MSPDAGNNIPGLGDIDVTLEFKLKTPAPTQFFIRFNEEIAILDVPSLLTDGDFFSTTIDDIHNDFDLICLLDNENDDDDDDDDNV
jgi:hypothetical protein